MIFHIITLFPQSFESYLNESILKRAILDKKIKVKFYNPRDFTNGFGYSDKRVDDKPYGGGPGMVIEALPVIKAIEEALCEKTDKEQTKEKKNDKKNKLENGEVRKKVKIVWLTPSGKQFNTSYAKNISKKYTDIIIICGRYEGIDARIKKVFKMEQVSVGPFVVTGGELPAMILIDSISRQIEGILGDIQSLEENRISSPDVYTRPEVLEYENKKYRVPKVLLSGNHKLIDEWRKNKKQ